TSGCKSLGTSSLEIKSICFGIKPNSSENPYIEVDGRPVPFGSRHERIQLENPSTHATYICDEKLGTFSWNSTENANQLRVTYGFDVLYIEAFWCDSFDGPKRANLHCVVEAFSSSCPGLVSHNHTCVFEVHTDRFSSDTVRDAVEVKTEVAVMVRNLAASFGVSHSKERTVVKTYSVSSRSYIVIPAGFRFCSFSEVISEEDYLSPTGFKWRCKLPTYVQTTMITGRCSIHSLCESQSLCSTATTDQPRARAAKKSAEAQPVAMLLALCMI
ncbi:Hypothetical predicted protein, partial [Paramuricea clavata]